MIVLYLYDKARNPLTQIFNVNDFSCTLRLNDSDDATIIFPANDKAIEYSKFKEFNRVRITNEVRWVVKTYIEWFVDSAVINSETMEVNIRSLEALLDRKILIKHNLNNTSVSSILTTLLNEINARENTGITVHSSTSTLVTSVTVEKGTTLLQAIKKLTALWLSFKIVDNKLLMAQSIWVDRTVPPNYYLFKRDRTDENDRNIINWSIWYDSKTITTAVTETSHTWFVTDAGAIAEFWYIEENIVVDTDRSMTLASELAKKKDSTRQVTVEPKINDFFFADIGDKVAVQINWGNDIAFYEWSSIVVEKSIRNTNEPTATLSNSNIYTKNVLDRIKSFGERISRLELIP